MLTIHEKAQRALDANMPVKVILKSGQIRKVLVTTVNGSLTTDSGKPPLDSVVGMDMETRVEVVIPASDIKDIVGI